MRDDYNRGVHDAVFDVEYMTFWAGYQIVGTPDAGSEGLRLGEIYRTAQSLYDRGADAEEIKRLIKKALPCRSSDHA